MFRNAQFTARVYIDTGSDELKFMLFEIVAL